MKLTTLPHQQKNATTYLMQAITLLKPLSRTSISCTKSFAASLRFASAGRRTYTSAHAPKVGTSGDRIVAGVVLSRDPVITRDLTEFEKKYFDYHDNLKTYNAAPFPTNIYFRKGMAAERRFYAEFEKKQMRAFDVAANENAKPEYKPPQKQNISAELAEQYAKQDEEDARENKVEFAPRTTKADEMNEKKSLDRALQRTLYLIVKKPREAHSWQFPQGGIEGEETIQEAAQRELAEECGKQMDTWFVGNAPIGHYSYKYPAEQVAKYSSGPNGAKVFFMKAHIFNGRVEVDNKEVVDYAWVTKEELKDFVHPDYYAAVKDILPNL